MDAEDAADPVVDEPDEPDALFDVELDPAELLEEESAEPPPEVLAAAGTEAELSEPLRESVR